MYVLKEPKEFSFEKVGIKGKMFSMSGISNKAQYLIIETESGHETTIVQQVSDFIYYILEGRGYFCINGQKEECSQGDLVVIPAGFEFTYKGKLRMLLSSTPPWTEGQEKTL